ncbi:MAG: DUF1446 domain-containing protein [Holophagales bacterium]|jgi:hypothetical protein|nr:DUF1446 domain-containing protein [Holophagales bacterium]
MKPFKVLSPTAILGYGFPEASFLKGMEEKPDLIAVDAGSTDPGPYYLGSGKSFTDRVGVKRDLRYMLTHGVLNKIPVVIGSAGGSGARPHVEWCRKIIEEIALEEKLSFRMGIVYADIDKAMVIEAVRAGQVTPLDDLPTPAPDDINSCPHIVAQMGIEPVRALLEEGVDVVLAGRAYDPVCFSALPIMKGYDAALATHMGKIIECAAIAATPGSGADAVLGVLHEKHFVLKALNPMRKFTALSTAAHSLYEKSDPYHLPGPGGALDLSNVTFTELETGEVEVRGTKIIPTNPYRIKLEGSSPVGFRTISIAGTRDPIMIASLDIILKEVKARVDELLAKENTEAKVFFHVYGKNGVMGGLEKGVYPSPFEAGIVIEVLAQTQEAADTVCSMTRSTLLHYGYEGRIATAGNLAFPFSPSDIRMGEAYQFTLYHLMDVSDPAAPFKREIVGVGGSK